MVLSQFLGDADPQTSCLAWESLRYLRTLEWGPDFLALFQGRPLYLMSTGCHFPGTGSNCKWTRDMGAVAVDVSV